MTLSVRHVLIPLAMCACTHGGSGVQATGAGSGISMRAVDNLLAVDRSFSEASGRTDLVSGISAMFARDVVVPVSGGGRRDGAIQFVNAADIDWIDAAGDSVRLRVGKSSHVLRKSMGEMLAMLDPRQFVRIHRSTIVNVERVKELQPWFHGEYVVVLRDGTKLKLSRGYRDNLTSLM